MNTILEWLCTLKTAKSLKKLGVTQDSHFSWCKKGGDWEIVETKDLDSDFDNYSAFTATEASDRFPKHVWISIGENGAKRREAVFHFAKHNGLYKASLWVQNSKSQELVEIHREEDKNEAEARCRLLVFIEKEANLHSY